MTSVVDLMGTVSYIKAYVSDHIIHRPYLFDFEHVGDGVQVPRRLGEPGEEHAVFWSEREGCCTARVTAEMIEVGRTLMVFEARMQDGDVTEAADVAADMCLMYDLAIEEWMVDYGNEGTTWMTVWGKPRVLAVPLDDGKTNIKVEVTYCLATSREVVPGRRLSAV